MNQHQLEALSKAVAYLWQDEKTDFEARPLNGDDAPKDHIFCQLEVLDGYLKARTGSSGVGPNVKDVEFLAHVGLATTRLEDAHTFLKTIQMVAKDIQDSRETPS